MITPSFGLTATERVLPKLALDFTTASLDSRITFTRTTSASNPATYVNSSGYVTSATNNQPRFDYDPISLICKGLLIEESRSNICLQSQNFNTTWIKTNVTVNTGSITSPDNTLTGDSMIETTSTTVHQISQNLSVTNTVSYTLSVFAKQNGRTQFRLDAADGFVGANNFVTFDLSNGSAVNSGNCTSTVTNYPNGWYRCTATFTAIATGTAGFAFQLLSAGNTTYTGDGVSGVYIWGAQVEAGAFATSYIPTTTTALTRNADVATMTGANFSSWCDTTQGTILSEHTVAQFNAANTIYAYSLGSAAAVEVYASIQTTGANQFAVFNTTVQANFAGFAAGTLNTAQKVCGYYQANNFAASANGVAGGTDLSGTVPTINKLVFGARNDGARVLNGWVRKFSYWPFPLTTAENTAFSKQ